MPDQARGVTDASGASIADALSLDQARTTTASAGAMDDAPIRASTPAETVAANFMTALSATVQRRPAPLPMPFRPMADVIAGPRPVMLSTDDASRRALRSVRKMAATTGDTIHLDPTAVPRARLDEVVAHELTHVAHPSPTPRFFDDIDDSPEERRAEQVARVMARSPLAPSSSVAAPSRPRGVDSRTIRRSPASPGAHRTETGSAMSSSGPSSTVSAAALAARLTSTTSSPTTSNGVIHRKTAPDPAPQAPAVDPVFDDVTSTHGASSSQQSLNGQDSPFASEAEADRWFDARLAASVGPLLRMIEDRMRIELERRGGRNWRRS